MKTHYLHQHCWQIILLCLANLVCAPSSLACDGPTQPFHMNLVPNERALQELEALNDIIEVSKNFPEQALKRGHDQVSRNNYSGKPNSAQMMPFRELLFPKAHTGIYVPTKPQISDQHQAIIIFLPGIGSKWSIAKSVFDIALTFQKTKKNPSLRIDNKDIRAAAFPMDLPLNGLGEGAPMGFGSARGNLAVLRHVVLYLTLTYPDKPIYIAGRSQGGLLALEYAKTYNDVAGVIAVSPSHPDPEIVQASVRIHEDDLLGVNPASSGQGVEFHPTSWLAYKTFTPGFQAIHHPSKIPTLILLGESDGSYPQPRYLEAYRAFQTKQPGMRNLVIYPNAGHNLWARQEEGLYKAVARRMATFIYDQID